MKIYINKKFSFIQNNTKIKMINFRFILSLLTLMFILSCTQQKDRQIKLFDDCETKEDSLKYSKLQYGLPNNLDILNGIKCFEFGTTIDYFKPSGNYINKNEWEEIRYNTNYCFNYKGICWNDITLFFLKKHLVGIIMNSDSEPIDAASSLSNEFINLLGIPKNEEIYINKNINDTIYCFIDNYQYLNKSSFTILKDHEEKNAMISEVKFGNKIEKNSESLIDKDVIFIGCTKDYLDKEPQLKYSYKPIIYSYNTYLYNSWSSNACLEILYRRDNPFRIDLSRAVNIDKKYEKIILNKPQKLKYYPQYFITIKYFKDKKTQETLTNLLQKESLDILKQKISNINDSLDNVILDNKKSF